jgi:hypothetical protein
VNIGYNHILQMRRAEAKANELGFMFCYPKHGWNGEESEGILSLQPKDSDSLPVYARDAQLFTGSLDAVITFMRGIEWARNYDMMIKVSDEKKRERKEQDVRNKKLVTILKGEVVESVSA